MQQRLETRAPTMPANIRRATIAMLAGLACSLVLAVAVFLDQTVVGGIEDRMWQAYPDYTQSETDAEVGATAAYLWVLAGLGVVCWLRMAYAARHGRRGTRVIASALLVLGVGLAATNSSIPMPDYLIASAWLPCIAGAVSVWLLWTRESAEHFVAGRSDQRRAQSPSRS